MRRYHTILRIQQRIIRTDRLGTTHVQQRPRDFARVQRVRQRLFIDQPASSGICLLYTSDAADE